MSAGVIRQICVGSVCTVLPHPANNYRPYSLRHPVLAALSAFLVAAKVLTVVLVAATPEVASLSTISGSALLKSTNAARAEAGLPALEDHPLLRRSAQLKAQDMIAHDYFEHTSPTGVTPWKWFDDAGYRYVYAGENLAIDFTASEPIHTAWMRSPGHRKNILSDKYRNIGIAVVTGEYEGRTTTVVVQHFGSLTAAAAPAPTAKPAATIAPSLPSPSPSQATPTPSVRTPTPAPAVIPPPSPPTILEPAEGDILPSGASTVRGVTEREASVKIALDGQTVGTVTAQTDGTFTGSVTPPNDQERDAVLSATASRSGKTSPPSAPRRVHIDTRGPSIADRGALFLPDPAGDPRRALLLLPFQEQPKTARAVIRGATLPLTLRGAIALASVPIEHTTSPVSIHAEDAQGNAHDATVTPARSFHVTPRTAGETDTRERVLKTTGQLRSITTIVLFVVATLLALNILVYIRIQHLDVIAHGLTVIAIVLALLWTT